MTDRPDPLRSPLTVVDEQIDLLRALRATLANRSGVPIHLIDDHVHMDPDDPSRPDESWPNLMPDSLAGATIWIGAEVAPLIDQAASTIPAPDAGFLAASVVPHREGCMWVAGDPVMLDGIDHPIRMMSWRVTPIRRMDDPGRWTPGVMMWAWSRQDTWTAVAATMCHIGVEAAAMVDTPGEMVAPSEVDDAVELRDGLAARWRAGWRFSVLRWMLAAWVLCGQHLPQHLISPPRPVSRRLARVNGVAPGWGDIHVTTLRRLPGDSPRDDSDDDTARVFAHQWVVRGHWRWQACGPGRSERRLIWIAPHIKGPEGAPLIEVEQVAKLVR